MPSSGATASSKRRAMISLPLPRESPLPPSGRRPPGRSIHFAFRGPGAASVAIFSEALRRAAKGEISDWSGDSRANESPRAARTARGSKNKTDALAIRRLLDQDHDRRVLLADAHPLALESPDPGQLDPGNARGVLVVRRLDRVHLVQQVLVPHRARAGVHRGVMRPPPQTESARVPTRERTMPGQ